MPDAFNEISELRSILREEIMSLKAEIKELREYLQLHHHEYQQSSLKIGGENPTSFTSTARFSPYKNQRPEMIKKIGEKETTSKEVYDILKEIEKDFNKER